VTAGGFRTAVAVVVCPNEAVGFGGCCDAGCGCVGAMGRGAPAGDEFDSELCVRPPAAPAAPFAPVCTATCEGPSVCTPPAGDVIGVAPFDELFVASTFPSDPAAGAVPAAAAAPAPALAFAFALPFAAFASAAGAF
jgi:hypothetical protein